MKLFVLGATGGCGKELVKQALEAGHQVTAVVRNPDKVKMRDDNLTIIKGDVSSEASLADGMKDQDAVISCLGAMPTEDTKAKFTFFSDSIRVIVGAMRAAGVDRLVCITAWCTVRVPEAPERIKSFWYPSYVGVVTEDQGRMEKYLAEEAKDIRYTCVRPPELNEEPLSGKPIIAKEAYCIDLNEGLIGIPRANVACFMLSMLTTTVWDWKGVAIALQK
ncbi:flavin reductase (NADPH)-like [Lingula anatina]|uniref:Flavin reductase (NADPH)-like n=1 Tax=Lingula anatina TaxID=7574 RepID=A0A1S3I5P9_LINAN|nr:flavin reductase (NADPH)-like [Lingula anatina]|eukprot:XP_013393600.1 flavin reductase (NADPH)-like [Lingula anatina]